MRKQIDPSALMERVDRAATGSDQKDRKFDLAAMMDTVSKLDTNPAPQVKMITMDDILANQDHIYTVDNASL
ncbi:MAG: hypothetical protein K2N78_03190, partial [Oscillospiraceae bacterium]|nr:hypothetical protein [Oscillospiraceae bacterium]